MHHMACALAFAALIAGQLCAVLIAGVDMTPSRGRPGPRSGTSKHVTSASRLRRNDSRSVDILGRGTTATAALRGAAGSMFAVG